ncbi:alpha/beta fold hydrolase [Williamsia sp. SKLECPSW1]
MTAPTVTEASEIFRRPPDRYVDVPGGAVAVRSVGEGPAILFVHGWPVSGATFRGLLPHLADRSRCHVIDLPGAGASRFDRSTPISIAAHVESVRAVVDDLGLDDVAVVGHDSGGMIARLALAGDPRVRAWGLIDSEHPGRPGLRLRMFLALRHLPYVEGVLGRVLASRVLRRNRFVLGDAVSDRDHLDGEFAEFFLEPLLTDRERLWAAGTLLRGFDLGAMRDLSEMHARMTAQVTVVQGGDDVFFPTARVRAMMSTFAGPSRLEIIEGGRLFVHEESPERVAAVLRSAVAGM